ncbi:MAG: PKD domain-containing protein, partial [Acidimicrobiales bacterium]
FLDGSVHTYDDSLPEETVLSWSSIAGDTCSPPGSLDVDLISAWDFDGDGTPDAYGPEVTFPGTDAGEYPVQLTVDDGFGGTHTVRTTVTVS